METVTFCANQLSMFNFFISKISTLYMYTVCQEIKLFFIYLILQTVTPYILNNLTTTNLRFIQENKSKFTKWYVFRIHNISKRYINQKNKKERKEYYVLEL